MEMIIMPGAVIRCLVIVILFGLVTTASNTHDRYCCGYSFNNTKNESICQDSDGCVVFSPQNGKLTDDQLGVNNPLVYNSPAVEECQIKRDPKMEGYKQINDESKIECLSENFIGEDIGNAHVIYGTLYDLTNKNGEKLEYTLDSDKNIDRTVPLPFSIHPYILSSPPDEKLTNPDEALPAIEVRVAYDGDRWLDDNQWRSRPSWNLLRFRIFNRDLCNAYLQDTEATQNLSRCSPRCVSISRGSAKSNEEKLPGTEGS